jgi:hypothetical protein
MPPRPPYVQLGLFEPAAPRGPVSESGDQGQDYEPWGRDGMLQVVLQPVR